MAAPFAHPVPMHPSRRIGQILVLACVLLAAACGDTDSNGRQPAAPTLAGFKTALQDAVRKPGDTPRGAAMETAIADTFASLDNPIDQPARDEPARDEPAWNEPARTAKDEVARTDPEGEDGGPADPLLVIASPPSALCASPAMDQVASLSERLTTAGTRIGDTIEACLSDCPSVSCETYNAAIVATERSASLSHALAGRMAATAILDEEAANGRLIRWRMDLLEATADSTKALLRLSEMVAAGQAVGNDETLTVLSNRFRAVSTEGARLIWDNQVQGAAASLVIAHLDRTAGLLATLAAFSRPVALPGDTESTGPVTVPEVLAGNFAAAAAEAGWRAVAAAETVYNLDLPMDPIAETETTGVCLLPVSRALAAVPSQLEPYLPRLRACAKAKGCAQRPQLSLDMLEIARQSPTETIDRLKAEASALRPASAVFADNPCP